MAGHMSTSISEDFEDSLSCGICRKDYTDPKVLSCLHSFCCSCLVEYFQKAPRARGAPERSLPCAICRTVTVFPKEGIDALGSDLHLHDLVEARRQKRVLTVQKMSHLLEQLKSDLKIWILATKDAASKLRIIAGELDIHFSRITKTKIAGSSAAVVGGVLGAVGFALSFFTFGASLGLVVAGGVIGGVGGGTAGGAAIADSVLSKKSRQNADESFKDAQSKKELLQKKCLKIGILLNDVDRRHPSWVKFWFNLVQGTGKLAGAGWNAIAKSVLNGLRVASYGDEAARFGTKIGTTVFRGMGTAARGFHIAGGVVGILLVPLDLYALVTSSIDEHKQNPHKVSKELREIAEGLENTCPSAEEVDQMINETIREYHRSTPQQ